MGAGGDGRPLRDSFLKRSFSIEKLKKLSSVKDDLIVLKSIWFSRAKGDDHAARLEHFYGPQAHAYDKFRANFLWGRRPMLAACAARLEGQSNLIWVDLGGGTGENVDMMSQYMPLDRFKSVYIVDLCHSLCEQAKLKVKSKGWKNVHVVEADACRFEPPEGTATLITFSYSLTMIPPFHQVVDRAVSYLDPEGFIGVADFFVSSKYDLPMRQMSWLRRFFWRATFDTDNIDIGPERRAYLESRLERVWEVNSQGSIPYVPYLRAPYYVWLGRVRQLDHVAHEDRVEAPPLFPPTFLYTQSWEDPEPDIKVFNINPKDVVLTLTSGGCNSLNLLVHGAGTVVAVDCNPAQSALLELKAIAIKQLDFEDVWLMFGEGKHPRITELYERKLAPFLSQNSHEFWSRRLWYFRHGLYWQGGMGKLCWVVSILAMLLGHQNTLKRLCNAPTIEDQRKIWNSIPIVYFVKNGPSFLVLIFVKLASFVLFNRIVLWFGGGVPCKQYKLIEKDGIPIENYIARTLNGAAENSHIRKQNYFYYNCLQGKFLRDNSPSYLQEANFAKLKAGAIDNLVLASGFFLTELLKRKYTKVILMDHVDWLDLPHAQELADALAKQVLPGGIVIWRSASLCPPYAKLIAQAGFDVKCISRADQGYMDRVNMYSSFFTATRKSKRE